MQQNDTVIPNVSKGFTTEIIASLIAAMIGLFFFSYFGVSVIDSMLKAQKAQKKTLHIRKTGCGQGSDQE